MRSRLTPPKRPRVTLGASPIADDEIDAVFASLEVEEDLMRSVRCDAVVTIGGRRVFLVKSSQIRE